MKHSVLQNLILGAQLFSKIYVWCPYSLSTTQETSVEFAEVKQLTGEPLQVRRRQHNTLKRQDSFLSMQRCLSLFGKHHSEILLA